MDVAEGGEQVADDGRGDGLRERRAAGAHALDHGAALRGAGGGGRRRAPARWADGPMDNGGALRTGARRAGNRGDGYGNVVAVLIWRECKWEGGEGYGGLSGCCRRSGGLGSLGGGVHLDQFEDKVCLVDLVEDGEELHAVGMVYLMCGLQSSSDWN